MSEGRDYPELELAAAALDAVAAHVAILDHEGRIVMTNRAWDEFGATSDDADADGYRGANYVRVSEAADDEYGAQAAEGIAAVLAGSREAFSLEYPCHSPTERQWFVLQVRPVVYEGDRYVVVSHVDVTERRLAELAVERRNAELTERQETLALINQIVRHDIRNDMEVVIGWAELLSEHVAEPGQRHLDNILEMSHHVTELTRSVGGLVDAIVEGDDLELEPVDLHSVVTTQVEALRAAHEYRSEEVTIVEPDPLEDATVLANDLLGSVVGNLLDNAVLHNDGPDPGVEVGLAVDESGEWIVFTVADDGPGIPDDRKDEVFGRGEKGLESSGSGLGLYLVDRLVDTYGGRVTVADNDPKGSVFEVWLRRASPESGRPGSQHAT